MISGCSNPLLQVKKYSNVDDLTAIVKNFIANSGSN